MAIPTPEQQAALALRFPMPKRADYPDEESYLEACDGQHRARRMCAPFGPGPSTDSLPPSK
jgi:hypothetical protein